MKRFLICLAMLSIFVSQADAAWFHKGERLPARPSIVIDAPTGHLHPGDRWCEWVDVTIKYDERDIPEKSERMYGCD
jgi:hypothetical protein